MSWHSSNVITLLECQLISRCLTTHKEKWVNVFRKNVFGFQSVCFTTRRHILHFISFGGIDQRLIIVIAVTVLSDQSITIRRSVCMTITIACDDLEVSKDGFENALCIGLIDQLLNLFRNQFVTFYQGLSNSHNRLAVFFEKTFHSLELGL